MDDLRELVLSLGHTDVATYLQSGNVVFRSRLDDHRQLARALEEGLAGDLGVETTVLVRSAADLATIAGRRPFAGAETAHLHVTLLSDEPEPERVEAMDGKRFLPDAFRVKGREVYVHCPGGYGRTKLGNAFFERELAVTATTRNWRTVTALAELADM
jgi:uncharacterized protein (DUF1697 family)